MKKVLMVLVVLCTTSLLFAQKPQTDTSKAKKALKKDIPLHSVSWDFFWGKQKAVQLTPSHTWPGNDIGGLNLFASIHFKKPLPNKLALGIFAGLNTITSMSSTGGNLDGKNFNTEYEMNAVYAGGALFYNKAEIGIGYQSQNLNHEHSSAIRMYAKYGPRYMFSCDSKMDNYFGYVMPFRIRKATIGAYININGFGPMVKISNKVGNGGFAFFATVTKVPTGGFTIIM